MLFRFVFQEQIHWHTHSYTILILTFVSALKSFINITVGCLLNRLFYINFQFNVRTHTHTHTKHSNSLWLIIIIIIIIWIQLITPFIPLLSIHIPDLVLFQIFLWLQTVPPSGYYFHVSILEHVSPALDRKYDVFLEICFPSRTIIPGTEYFPIIPI